MKSIDVWYNCYQAYFWFDKFQPILILQIHILSPFHIGLYFREVQCHMTRLPADMILLTDLYSNITFWITIHLSQNFLDVSIRFIISTLLPLHVPHDLRQVSFMYPSWVVQSVSFHRSLQPLISFAIFLQVVKFHSL